MKIFTTSKVLVVFFTISFVSLLICALYASPFKKNVKMIRIIDGSSGQQIVLEQEKAQHAIKKLSSLTYEMKGVPRGWSCGYTYKIELTSGTTVQEILVSSPYEFVRGGIKYKTNENIEAIINTIICEYVYNE